jgi:hypothetical protein
MRSRLLKQYVFPPLCLLIVLLTVRTAEACSCGPSPTVLDAFNYADVVVIVSVVSVEKAEPEKTAPPGRMSDGTNYVHGVKSTSMSVEQAFKGTLKVGDEMIFAQGGGANLHLDLQRRGHWTEVSFLSQADRRFHSLDGRHVREIQSR